MVNKIVYKYNEVYPSPNESDIKVSLNGLDIYFSSTTNQKRFNKKLPIVQEKMQRWIQAYGLENTNILILQILKTYEESENRGFKIIQHLGEKVVHYSCREEMKISLILQKHK